MRQPVFTWPTLRWPRLSLRCSSMRPVCYANSRCFVPRMRFVIAVTTICPARAGLVHNVVCSAVPPMGPVTVVKTQPHRGIRSWPSAIIVPRSISYCTALNTAANSGWQPHWRDYCCWPYWPNAVHAPAHGPICCCQYRCIANVNGGEVSTKQHFWPSRCHTGCKSRSIQTY